MIVGRQYIYQLFVPFWNQVWNETSLMETATAAFREGWSRLETDRAAIQDNLNRFAIPLAFFRHFHYRLVKEDELARGYRTLGTFALDDGVHLDELDTRPPVWILDMPEPASVELLLTSPVRPTTIWQRGQEFDYADGKLYFYKDPFESGFLSNVTSADGVIRRTCKFWFCDTQFDVRSVKDFFAIYFGVQTPTTEYYKRLVNIIWDFALEGATTKNITAFLCALADTDTAFEDGQVQEVWTENGRVFVTTPNAIHSAPDCVSATVAVGDIVEAGQNIFDAVTIWKGTDTISASDFPMLHLGEEFLSVKYRGGILLENREFVITNSRFPVGGLPATVDSWWDDVETDMGERGLDLWAIETAGQNYPYRLNPFDFIKNSVLKTNSLFIKMNRLAVPDPEINFKFMDYLLEYMPAATTFFMHISGEIEDEDLTSWAMRDTDGEAFHAMLVKEQASPGLDEITGMEEDMEAKHKLW